MANEYNIQMHEYNGTDYDNLYPKTRARYSMLSDSAAELLNADNVEQALMQGGAGGAGSLCTITFDEVFSGQPFTVVAGTWNKGGTVPTSSPYEASVSLPYTGTTYTITCAYEGTNYSTTVTTGDYYGSCTAQVKRATLNINFGAGLAGKTYSVREGSVSGTEITSGTVGDSLKAEIGVAPDKTYYAVVTVNNMTWSGSATPTISTAGTINLNSCTITITVDSDVAGQDYTVSNGSATVDSGTASTSMTLYVPRTAATYTFTTHAPSAYGGCEFTGSASVTTSSATAAINIEKATLIVTYGNDFKGGSATISGTGVSILASIPNSAGNAQTTSYLPKNTGTVTIQSTITSGTYKTTVNIGTTDTVTATLNSISSVLNENSFDIISTVSNNGNGASYWSVGDRKGVALSGTIGQGSYTTTLNKTYYMSIIGFDHNSTKEGANRIHFQFGWTDLTGGTQIAFCTWSSNDTWGTSTQNGAGGCMNTTNTNVGGWPQCIMRTGTLGQNPTNPTTGSFMAALPADLRNVMKSVTKTTNKGNNGGATYETSTDYLWLPSEYEVFAANGNSGGNQDQVQYDYYKGVTAAGTSASKNAFTAAGKIRYNHQNTSQAVYWWERSPYASYTGSFCFVDGNGDASYGGANYSRGFAPCLCI